MSRRWLALAWLWLAGCASDGLTEILVVIEAQPGILAQAKSLSVKVYGETASDSGFSSPRLDVSGANWTNGTYTIALSPENPDRAGRYLVEASALKDGLPIATARLISGYVLGETRYVRLLIEDQCVGMSCDSSSTCMMGGCVSAEVSPSTFAHGSGGIVETDNASVAAADAAVGQSDAAPAGPTCVGVSCDSGSTEVIPNTGGQVKTDGGNMAAAEAAIGQPDGGPGGPPCGAADLATCAAQASKYVAAGDYVRAVPLLTQACNGGNMRSCTSLGIAYWYGRGGLTMDVARSVQLYTQACNGGDMLGCTNLGLAYEYGPGGLTMDVARAVQLYTQACNGGDMFGCNNLGAAYEYGRGGLTMDVARAVQLYTQACNGGSMRGCNNLGTEYENGRGGLTMDVARALQLYTQACDGGEMAGCTNATRLKP